MARSFLRFWSVIGERDMTRYFRLNAASVAGVLTLSCGIIWAQDRALRSESGERGADRSVQSTQDDEGADKGVETGRRVMRQRGDRTGDGPTPLAAPGDTRVEVENATSDQSRITVWVVNAKPAMVQDGAGNRYYRALYERNLGAGEVVEARLYRGNRGVVVYDRTDRIILADQFTLRHRPLLVQIVGDSSGGYSLDVQELP
jgi:hypothetical protein